MRILLALGIAVATMMPISQQAVGGPYFRFQASRGSLVPPGPGPVTPETPTEVDTILFARAAFEGERDVEFSTGEPATTLPSPIDYSLSSDSSPLPPGLSVESSTGLIGGTPTKNGTFPNIVVAGVSGIRSAKSAAVTIVVTGVTQGADVVLPASATIPGGGSSKLNVSHLLGQYVPMGKPSLAPGESIEIAYSEPVQADGAHIASYPIANSFRVDAEIDGGWRTLKSNLAGKSSSAAPISLGNPVTASRYRIVNTGTQTLTGVTTGMAYGGNWAQLAVLTTQNRLARLKVGDSFNAGVDVYVGPQGYGSITFRAPWTFSLVRGVNMPQVEDAYFQNPDGITLNASTGVVSGTASAPTWSPWTPNGPDPTRAQTRRDTYIAATDADGYVVYGLSRTFVVDATLSAGTVKPIEVTVDGVAMNETQLSQLENGRASVLLYANSRVIAKYANPVSASMARFAWNGSEPNWTVFFSQDQGAHWLTTSDTETTKLGLRTVSVDGVTTTTATGSPTTNPPSGMTTAVLTDPLLGSGTGSATGSWIMLVPNRGVTLKGFVIGKDGTFPTPYLLQP